MQPVNNKNPASISSNTVNASNRINLDKIDLKTMNSVNELYTKVVEKQFEKQELQKLSPKLSNEFKSIKSKYSGFFSGLFAFLSKKYSMKKKDQLELARNIEILHNVVEKHLQLNLFKTAGQSNNNNNNNQPSNPQNPSPSIPSPSLIPTSPLLTFPNLNNLLSPAPFAPSIPFAPSFTGAPIAPSFTGVPVAPAIPGAPKAPSAPSLNPLAAKVTKDDRKFANEPTPPLGITKAGINELKKYDIAKQTSDIAAIKAFIAQMEGSLKPINKSVQEEKILSDTIITEYNLLKKTNERINNLIEMIKILDSNDPAVVLLVEDSKGSHTVPFLSDDRFEELKKIFESKGIPFLAEKYKKSHLKPDALKELAKQHAELEEIQKRIHEKTVERNKIVGATFTLDVDNKKVIIPTLKNAIPLKDFSLIYDKFIVDDENKKVIIPTLMNNEIPFKDFSLLYNNKIKDFSSWKTNLSSRETCLVNSLKSASPDADAVAKAKKGSKADGGKLKTLGPDKLAEVLAKHPDLEDIPEVKFYADAFCHANVNLSLGLPNHITKLSAQISE